MTGNRFIGLVDDSATSAPLQATLSESMKENPDSRAKILNLSNKTGIPANAIEDDVQGVETQARLNDINTKRIAAQSPVTNRFLSDYDNASIAHDDIENLEQTEHLFSGLGGTILRRYQDMLAGTELMGLDQRQKFIAELGGTEDDLNQLEPRMREIIQRNVESREQRAIDLLEGIRQRGGEIDQLTPKNMSILEEGTRAGVESLSVMLPAMAAGVFTRTGTPGVLFAMGASTMGNSYASARDQGLEPAEALLYSQLQTAIEVGTEVLPVNTLMDIMSGKVGTKMGKKVMQFVVREMGTEQLATFGQSLVDYSFELDEQLEQAESLAEMAAIQSRRQAVTAVATVVGGGAQIGIASSVGKAVEKLSTEQNISDTKGAVEQETLDRVAEAAENSELKKRSKEAYRKFTQDISPGDVVYVDGPQAALYLQEQDDIESDPVLSAIAEQIEEANVTNGEVVIPAADFATDVVGSDHYEALRPHMTMSSDTVSPFRQEQEKEASESYVRQMFEKAESNTSAYVANRAIFDDAVEQLVSTGQVSPKAAKHMAEIVPAWATVKSKELGIPVEELYAKVGLQIEGPFEDRKDALAEGQAGLLLDQQDFGDLTFDEQHVRAATGEKITVKKPVQRVFEQKQKQRTMAQKLLDCVNG